MQNAADDHDIAFHSVNDDMFAVDEPARPSFVRSPDAGLFADKGENPVQLMPIGFGLSFVPGALYVAALPSIFPRGRC